MRISLRSSSRRTDITTTTNQQPRKGFVIVEVIVAMVLLAVAVTGLAGLVYSVSQSGIRATGDAYKNGVLMHEVNRLIGLPFDSVRTGSYSVQTGTYKHTRTVTVTPNVPNVISTIKIVITPLNPKYKKDSVTFIRTKARTSRVLCVTCQ